MIESGQSTNCSSGSPFASCQPHVSESTPNPGGYDDPIQLPFCFEFDGSNFKTEHSTVTAGQIRTIVGDVAPEVPIVQILEDGTQRTLSESEEVQLVVCIRFRRLPRFTRGRDRVSADIEILKKDFKEVTVGANHEYFIIRQLQLPQDLYVQASTDLMVIVPPTYNIAPPDNFYTSWGLSLRSGRAIDNYSGPVELHGAQWGMFSHHVDSTSWSNCDFSHFIASAIARLQEGA